MRWFLVLVLVFSPSLKANEPQTRFIRYVYSPGLGMVYVQGED